MSMEQIQNRVAQLTAIQKIEMADAPMPKAGPGEVVVKTEYCGICGSDMHFYTHGSIGKKVAPFPFILGHECSGYVAELGEGVTTLKVGDRVIAAKYAGTEVKVDGEECQIVRQSDILATVE